MEAEPHFLRILLVEDDPGDAELVGLSLNLLQGRKRVVYVTNLADAIGAKQDNDEFDVILLDLSLPDSFGFSTVTSVRTTYPTSPIVVLTGLDDPSVENKIVEFGAQDYLVKGSFDEQSLMRAIRHAIVRHKLEQSLKSSEAEQRAIINLAPEAILVLSQAKIVTTANPAAAKMFAQDIIGLSISGVLPDVLRLCQSNTDECEFRGDGTGLRDGVTFPVAIAIARLDEGRLLVMATDITERVRFANELQELARTDPLTGLSNRRAFIERAETEFHRCKRSRTQSAVLMIDIDHFKRVNDIHGHEAGDRALVALAEILNRMVRTTDLSARFGGEEFVVLLTDVDQIGAMEMAERIRVAVSQIVCTSSLGDFGFTISIGVALFVAQDFQWSDTLRRADQGLYQAKNNGRNQVVLFMHEDAP